MGGSEGYVWTLSRAQSKEHDVHIYTTTRHLERSGTSFHEGVTVHRSYAPITIWNINPLTYMLPALTNSEADVFHIHSHLYLTSNQAVLAKLMRKRKALLHLHGGVGIPPYMMSWPKLSAKRFYDRTLGKFTIENCDIIASVSHSDLKIVAEDYSITQDRLRYIPNVVDTEKFKPRATEIQEEKTLLYLGDLEPWKGIGSLLKWVLRSSWRNREFKLRFVGQGSYLRALLALQKKLSASGNGVSLEVLGPRNHDAVPALLNESSGLILPSYWEGMPTVVLEAMASGVPVISTRVGDVPQLLEHGKTGFLIDRSVSSFREAVDSVLCDTSLVRSIVRNARKLIEREYTVTHAQRISNNAYCRIAS